MDIHIDKRIKNYSLVLLLVACFMFILLGYFAYFEGKDVQLQNFQEIGYHYTKFAERAISDILVSSKAYSQAITNNQFVTSFANKPYDLLTKYRAELFINNLEDDIANYKCIKVVPNDLENLALKVHRKPDFETLLYVMDNSYFDYNINYISPIVDNDGNQEFTIISPIYYQEKLVGQLHLTIDMTGFIEEFITNTFFKETGYIFIIDEEKNIISNPSKDIDEIEKIIFSIPLKESVFEKNINKTKRYFYLQEVNFSNVDVDQVMHLIFTQESKELFSFNREIIFSTVRVISIFVVVFAILTLTYTRRHLRLVSEETKIVVEETLDFEVEKQTRKFRKIAETDSLTGLYNHGAMHKIIEKAIKASTISMKPLTLMMLDVDYFKDVNDTYGHQIGDEVLKDIANLLLDNIRELDFAGRYGGEEFIVLLKNTHLDIGYTIAERIRKNILAIDFTDEHVKISISIGISEWDGDDVSSFIKNADKKLYASKSYGRNKTTF